MNKETKKFKLTVSLVNIALFLIVFVFVTRINSIYNKYELKVEEFKKLEQSLQEYVNSLTQNNSEISLYIKDLSTEYEIKINSDKEIPSASLVKIPIMAAVYELAEKGDLSLNEKLTYKKKYRCGGSGIIKRSRYGTKFTIRELVELMISLSDNVATHMLIDRIGIKNLNKIFKELGLKNTNIDRFVMDLQARDKGIENYTTAEDIGLLLEKIYRGKLVSKEASIEMLLIMLKQRISDRIPKKLPTQVAVAHKTGLMKDVCHDAGVVYTNNGDFIICVLTHNIKPQVAKEIIADVAYMTYCMYDKNYVEEKGEKVVDDTTNTDLGDDTGGN
jgi:beta-lactamase class A